MMPIDDFLGLIRDVAVKEIIRLVPALKIGYVTSFDPGNYAVRVRLEPESTANEQSGRPNPVVESNWLPLNRPYGGNGWGLEAPPHANPTPPYGDMVLVAWADIPALSGFAIGPFYTDKERSAKSVSISGELRLTHPSGAYVELRSGGAVRMVDDNGNKMELPGNGTAKIDVSGGSIVISSGGSITATGSGGGKIVISGNVEIN